MDKIDLIYTIVTRLEEKVDKRLNIVEKDIDQIKTNRNKVIGFVGCLSLFFTLFIKYIFYLFK